MPGLLCGCQLLQQKSRMGGSTWGALGLAGWLISSAPAIRNLCNHVQVQITGLVSEPMTLGPGPSSWHLLARITHLSGSGASHRSAHELCSSLSTHPQMNQLAEFCQTARAIKPRNSAKAFQEGIRSLQTAGPPRPRLCWDSGDPEMRKT